MKYQLLTYPNPAVGCVVVKNDKLLSIEAHKESGLPHAEVNALKEAFLNENKNSVIGTLKSSMKFMIFIKNHDGFLMIVKYM